jgi:hypothetical protein
MRKVFLLVLFFLGIFLLPTKAFALTFDLIPPSGQLKQGQEIKFTINIDTEGKSYASTQIGMTYDTQALEYVSVSPGDTFATISSQPQDGGKMIITGSSTNGYSGSGVFAYVTFKIIATSPGSTQLCALFNPDATPTIAPTSPPKPTALPTSGETNGAIKSFLMGTVFLALAGSGFLIFKKI